MLLRSCLAAACTHTNTNTQTHTHTHTHTNAFQSQKKVQSEPKILPKTESSAVTAEDNNTKARDTVGAAAAMANVVMAAARASKKGGVAPISDGSATNTITTNIITDATIDADTVPCSEWVCSPVKRSQTLHPQSPFMLVWHSVRFVFVMGNHRENVMKKCLIFDDFKYAIVGENFHYK